MNRSVPDMLVPNSRRAAPLAGLALVGLALVGLVLVLLAAGILLPVRALAATPDERFVPVEELAPGDRCVGRTVFSGTDVEEFELEILGIVRGASPGEDLIIGRAEGDVLEETGILEGMSGSPVYLDGRLVGAVASTWQFVKQPIAGITPIAEMLPALDLLGDEEHSDAGRAPLPGPLAMIPETERETSSALRLAELTGTPVAGRADTDEMAGIMFGERRLTSIAAPLVVSGASEDFLSSAGRLFGSGVTPMAGAAAGSVESGGAPEPGSAVGIQFVRGDANWTAIGTVTHVEGDRLVAFGHPLFNSGRMDMPMVSAYVHALMPMQSISFKYATGGELLGAFRQDRNRAVAGVLGAEPTMVPVSALLRAEDGDHDFEFEVVDGRPYTAVFGGMAVGGAVSNAAKQSGPVTIELKASVAAGGEVVDYRDVFHTSAPAMRVSGELSMLLTVINENAFEDIDVTNVDVELSVREGELWTTVERVDADRAVYRPGDDVRLTAHLRTRRGERFQRDLTLRVPPSAVDGPLAVRVSDASTYQLLEQDRLGPGRAPRTLDQLFELIRNAKSGDTVVAQMISDAPGFSLSGEEIRTAPGRAGLAMAGSTTGGAVDASVQSVLAQAEFSVEGQVLGFHEMIITVKRDR